MVNGLLCTIAIVQQFNNLPVLSISTNTGLPDSSPVSNPSKAFAYAMTIRTSTRKPEYDTNVFPMLTGEIIPVLSLITKLVDDFAVSRFGISIPDVHVSGFTDPEEGVDYVTVVVKVPTDPDTALDFWDELGEHVQEWIQELPPDIAKIAKEKINTRVMWG